MQIADGTNVRVLTLISFLVLVLTSVPLLAQRSSTGSSNAGSIGDNSAFQGVTNVSEQAAAQGSFVGSGRPSAFVGIDEVYTGSSASSRSSANSSRRTTTTSRPAARTTMQRRAAQPGAARSNMFGGSNNQFIRTVTSIDFDVASPSPQNRLIMAGAVESSLNRIQGIQDGQVTFKDSPTGTTAVLTGTAASERERRVAQQLLLLEPGIHQVENLLEIR